VDHGGTPGSVLVTGGCGFIGVNLARRLRSLGAATRAFDNGSTGRIDDGRAAGYDDVVVGDVRDLDALREAAAGCDAVVHLAAQTGVVPSVEDPRTDLDVNVVGTLNALLAARDAGAGVFVFASSAAPLGAATPPGREDTVPRPLSPYGASKLAGEGLCHAFWGSYGLRTVALRFTNVYGPWSYHKGSVVATFMRNAMAGEPLVVYGDGDQTRDFLFVDDLCDAIVTAAVRAPGGSLYQLGTGAETTIAALVEEIRRLFAPRPVRVEHRPARPGEVRRSYADPTRARTELGLAPSTPLAHGLVRTRDWFAERGG
jgi:UDP-glucose 4-epimerase